MSQPMAAMLLPPVPPPQVWDRIDAALFPKALESRRSIQQSGMRFVHYTSAEGAEGILKNSAVWLRSTTCMNDFSEATHGYKCLLKAWHGDSGKAIRAALGSCHPGVAEQAGKEFDEITGTILNGSFIACFSVHDPKEDQYGRLSMWRAYCNPSGVAIVLNSTPFFARSDALKAYSSPVAYLDDREFSDAIQTIAANVEKEKALISSLDRQIVLQILKNMFRFAILCTKHPAFAEEREWRIVYTPDLFASDHIKRQVRTIRGTAQPVYDLPLKNIPEEGLTGIEIPELVHKIIIGPTQYGAAIRNALWFLLKDAGVTDPTSRLFFSDVPLRT